MSAGFSRRSVDGILLLDKPMGYTSNQALQKVKGLFRAQKAGHGGSLDPIATGMLPIFLGSATRLASLLLNADKQYVTLAQLGIKTETGDREGKILSTRPVEEARLEDLENILSSFRGKIQQIPPMYSALKQGGKPLYTLARQGLTVERAPREVNIYRLELLERRGSQLLISVKCSKGTYVRTLVEDIGEALGCGAHVQELRRMTVGMFSASQMVDLPTLERAAALDVNELDRWLLKGALETCVSAT